MRFFKWQETVRRGEPTREQREALEERLLREDLEGALLRAKAYAMKRTGKNEAAADQLVLDARRILWERCAWDPSNVSLGAYLCGVIRSQISHEAEAAVGEREREVEYLTEVETVEGSEARSVEEMLIERAESIAGREAAARRLDELRKHFEERGDRVNLLWIEYALDDVEDPAEMARRSGLPVEEFYRARDRRVRLVQRLRAARGGGTS